MYIFDDTVKTTKEHIKVQSIECALGDYIFVRLEKNEFVDCGLINTITREFISDKVAFFLAAELGEYGRPSLRWKRKYKGV